MMRFTRHIIEYSIYARLRLDGSLWLFFILSIVSSELQAEGTPQLEPVNAPAHSYCRIALSNNETDHRIPFAQLGCSADYRLNIRIQDFTKEKIYIGFGQIINYFEDTSVLRDVNYQIYSPDLAVAPGFSLREIPHLEGEAGFIKTRAEANAGPNINGSNPSGYLPLVLTPTQNGDYFIEFEIPLMDQTEARIFKYFDITVAKGNTPIPGRLWSKAWQLSSANVDSKVNSSFSSFFIYSDDGIVTRFSSNGLAGGIWSIYSNEFGCSTSGSWTERRKSMNGNASVTPQYKIFLSDPDPDEFPSGVPGEMYSFGKHTSDCDTLLTFVAEVSKNGNIEILLDLPPSNPGTTGVEDVQLAYAVHQGINVLTPGWDGKSSIGKPIPNGTVFEARIRYLNGLSNLPLFDVEDNPEGFMVDIQRPAPANGMTKLNIFWDDSSLPPDTDPTVNTVSGCIYTGISPFSGCHSWSIDSNPGDRNTINSWWYYSTDATLNLPVTLKLGPKSGKISGPADLCFGQSAIFKTLQIPHADQYSWEITGPGYHQTIEKTAPDTSIMLQFSANMTPGIYYLKMRGISAMCGSGPETGFAVYLYGNQAPPIHGNQTLCSGINQQFSVDGSFLSVEWTTGFGTIIGSTGMNPVTIFWQDADVDTVKVITRSSDCGTRESWFPVSVLPSASVNFSLPSQKIACKGVPVNFTNLSTISQTTIANSNWNWGDGQSEITSGAGITHSYHLPGTYLITLTETTQQGCITSKTDTIRVKPPPIANFSIFRNCQSDSLILNDLSAGEEITTWKWNYNNFPETYYHDQLAGSGAIYSQTGTFPVTLTVSNKYGCTDSITRSIEIHQNPVAEYTYAHPCARTRVLFSDQSSEADTSLASNKWTVSSPTGAVFSTFGNPVNLTFDEAGQYQVMMEVTDEYGCRDKSKKSVRVYSRPYSSFSSEANEGGNNGLVTFINHSEGGNQYYWDFGNGEISVLSDPQIRYNRDGNYLISLIVKNDEGCSDTSHSSYFYTPEVLLPNAFSPDFNGNNDIFRPVTQNQSLQRYQMLIFNKWGQLVYEGKNPAEGWDGRFRGNACNTGEYVYLLQYTELTAEGERQVKRKGMVLLLR